VIWETVPGSTSAGSRASARGACGGLPWIATVSGLVVLGAEVAGWRTGEQGTFVFDLRPPGSWFDGVHGRWFRFQEGRPWFFWDPTRLPQ
jgi:hypothetical protein